MWSDPSKRPLIVIAALFVAAVAGVFLFHRARTAPERHVTSLIALAYDYADIEPGNNLNYNRQQYAACSGVDRDDDAWAGFRGSTTGPQEGVDFRFGAERAAQRFEAEGWEVHRFFVPKVNGDDRIDDIRYLHARRNQDRIYMDFSNITLDIGASTGPCVPGTEFPPEPPRPADPVDRFPD